MNTYFKKGDYIFEIGDTRIYKRDGLINQISYDLVLVCGYDYVPYEDHQGWISADNFTSIMQEEVLSSFPLVETFEESLKFYEFEIVKNLPKIEDIA